MIVEGVNRVYKHVRRSQKNPQGGRLSKEMPIPVSNVMLICPQSNKRDARRFSLPGGRQQGAVCQAKRGFAGEHQPAGHGTRRSRRASTEAVVSGREVLHFGRARSWQVRRRENKAEAAQEKGAEPKERTVMVPRLQEKYRQAGPAGVAGEAGTDESACRCRVWRRSWSTWASAPRRRTRSSWRPPSRR